MIGQRSGFTVLMQVWFGSGDEPVQNFHLGRYIVIKTDTFSTLYAFM